MVLADLVVELGRSVELGELPLAAAVERLLEVFPGVSD